MSFIFKTTKNFFAVIIIFTLVLAPLSTHAQVKEAVTGAVIACSGVSDLIPAVVDKVKGFLSSFFGGGEGGGGDAVPIANDIIEKSTKNLKAKETCSDAISYEAAKALIAELAGDNLSWVTSAVDGNPLYLLNQKNFFSNLRLQEIEKILSKLLLDQNKYPYGKESALGITNDSQPFEQKIIPTLKKNNLDAFQEDFTQGGWETFTEFAKPQNNLFGSYLLTREHAAQQTQKKEEETKNELAWGDGFLSKKRADCDTSDPNCQVETPGSVIGNQIKTFLSSPIRQLEQADELSEVLSKLFTSLTGQLTTKGLTSVGNGSNYSSGETPWQNEDNGVVHDEIEPETIDLSVDLSGIIKDQETFAQKLAEQNVLIQTLINKIRELDFCVPGPRPTYEKETGDTIKSLIEATGNWEDQPSNTGFIIRWLGLVITPNDKIGSKDKVATIFDQVFNQYKKYVGIRYSKNPSDLSLGLPVIASSAAEEFSKIEGYYLAIEENKQKIIATNNVIATLKKIQVNINKPGVKKGDEEYEKQEAIFALLAPKIAGKDTLKEADDFLVQLNAMADSIDMSIDLCIEETTDPLYGRPTERLQYSPAVDTHGLKINDTYLPGRNIDTKGTENENIKADGGCEGQAAEICDVDFSVFEESFGIY